MKQIVSPPQEFMRICARNGLRISEIQAEQLSRFVEGVLEWNSRINLISRKDQEKIWFSHVLHSLSLLFYIEIGDEQRVLDLGTGGGFPGLPLAIMRPGARFLLLDSIAKKTRAVGDLLSRLGLQSVAVYTGRAEEVFRDVTRSGKFDIVVARAVASLRDLIRWSRPYLREGQTDSPPVLVALKGGDLEGEIAEARIKESPASLRVINMSFEGSAELGINDKRAVVVAL